MIGVLRGSDPVLANEFVVYTAHLDHLGIGAEVDGDGIHNGALDNALGSAVLMETARLAAQMPRTRKNWQRRAGNSAPANRGRRGRSDGRSCG